MAIGAHSLAVAIRSGQIYSSKIVSFNVRGPEIGDFFAGGIVFYLDGYGGGLVSAPSDQSTGVEWGDSGILVGGTSTGVGTGAANTIAIVNALGGGAYAAKICAEIDLNGYTDWFLPSKDALYLMYQNLHQHKLGDFYAEPAGRQYWSSSEYNVGGAWSQQFDDGYQGLSTKVDIDRIRAVRAF